MIKQCDLENGDTLDAVEKYNLELEQRKNFFEYLKKHFGLQIVEDEKEYRKEVKEGEYIRTCDNIFIMKYRMKGFYICDDIFDKREYWVDIKSVKDASLDIYKLLKQGDEILIRNDNGILIECKFFEYLKNKKKEKIKICAIDPRDNERMIAEFNHFVRIIKLNKKVRSW